MLKVIELAGYRSVVELVIDELSVLPPYRIPPDGLRGRLVLWTAVDDRRSCRLMLDQSEFDAALSRRVGRRPQVLDAGDGGQDLEEGLAQCRSGSDIRALQQRGGPLEESADRCLARRGKVE